MSRCPWRCRYEKKVFSGYKFLERCILLGRTDNEILYSLETWGIKCEGLTKTEMKLKYNCVAHDSWMTEIECDELEV